MWFSKFSKKIKIKTKWKFTILVTLNYYLLSLYRSFSILPLHHLYCALSRFVLPLPLYLDRFCQFFWFEVKCFILKNAFPCPLLNFRVTYLNMYLSTQSNSNFSCYLTVCVFLASKREYKLLQGKDHISYFFVHHSVHSRPCT